MATAPPGFNYPMAMKYFRIHIFGLLTIGLITILSLMPAQEFPQVEVRFADKWTHGVMYGFLTLVMGLEAIRRRRKGTEKGGCPRPSLFVQFLCIMLFSAAWGVLMELCQAYLTTTRSGDCMDALANGFGTLCAFIGLTVYHLCTRKA